MPRCPSHGECLTIKGDRRVVPVLWLDACAKELVTGIEPISLCFTYVRCLAQVTDVDASGLLDGSSAVSTSSRHRSYSLAAWWHRPPSARPFAYASRSGPPGWGMVAVPCARVVRENHLGGRFTRQPSEGVPNTFLNPRQPECCLGLSCARVSR